MKKNNREVSIPFIAGQWSLLFELRHLVYPAALSQSPSLRGSGRFPPTWSPSAKKRSCLNPLHCGAVVASDAERRRSAAIRVVSIPFIAGQWSLLIRPSSSPVCLSSLNPLHCGAVVASNRPPAARRGNSWSQSPSLRGSGRFAEKLRSELEATAESQSPSLRGSGRFL